jgi:hypothetical protein
LDLERRISAVIQTVGAFPQPTKLLFHYTLTINAWYRKPLSRDLATASLTTFEEPSQKQDEAASARGSSAIS